MRHRKNSKRLSRQSAHRKAVLRNQVKSILEKEKIKTTLTLAKESRRLAEKLITLGKKDTLAARRQAYAVLADRSLVKLLFSEIAPRFGERAGGYTRIVHLGKRLGDNASLVILELTELKPEEKKTKKVEKKTAAKETKKQAPVKKEKAKSKKSDELSEVVEAEVTDIEKEEDKKGFLGGLRKFLKQDNKLEKKDETGRKG